MNDLNRFIEAQELDYLVALNEIKNGKKRSHWIWYIFPQLAFLGNSSTAKYYGIKDLDEAKLYLENEYLKNHLIEISKELLKIDKRIEDIVNYPDDLKIKSSMTLFNYVDPSIEVFKKVLDKFYDGKKDEVTLEKIRE